MMRKFLKIATPLCLICCSIFLSYKLAYSIGEKYFFDRLFYKKSAAHGYSQRNGDYEPELTSSNQAIKERTKDLRNLIALAGQEDNQTLGVQDENAYKIAVIGDSYAYGEGVKKNKRFTEVLNKKLNKIRPTCVFTFGLPGDEFLENYSKFLLAKQYLNIDLYIFSVFTNDIQLRQYPDRYPNLEQAYLSIKPLCPKEEFIYIRPNPPATWEEQVSKGFYPASLDQYSNICFLKEITRTIASGNVVFYSIHSLEHTTGPIKLPHFSDKSTFLLHKYASVIKENGGNIISPSNIDNYVYERISKMEGHPSNKTHQLHAESLFKEITENPRYGFMYDHE